MLEFFVQTCISFELPNMYVEKKGSDRFQMLCIK